MNPFVVLTTFVALASAFSINTPASLVVCQPQQITWSTDGALAPFYLSIVPAGQPTADALKQFPPQQGSSFTWPKVDLSPGTGVTFCLKDASGQQVYSAPTTVQKSSDTSCVNNDVMEGGSATSPDQAPPVPAKGYPGGGTASQSSAPSSSAPTGTGAAGSPTPKSVSSASMPGPSSSKTEVPKMSGSSVSPNRSPTVKANSAGPSTPWTVFGIMSAVGLTSIVISVVV